MLIVVLIVQQFSISIPRNRGKIQMHETCKIFVGRLVKLLIKIMKLLPLKAEGGDLKPLRCLLRKFAVFRGNDEL